jgi:hypothetical protein
MHTGTLVKNCVALRGNINKKTDAKNVYNFWYCVIHRKQVIEFSHIQYSIEYITSKRVLDIRVDRLIDSDYSIPISRNRKEIHSQHCQMMNGASETADDVDLSTKNMNNTASISPSTERLISVVAPENEVCMTYRSVAEY